MKDPIVEEIRMFRDEHAKRFKYDLDAIFADIRRHQAASGRSLAQLPAKRAAAKRQSSPSLR